MNDCQMNNVRNTMEKLKTSRAHDTADHTKQDLNYNQYADATSQLQRRLADLRS